MHHFDHKFSEECGICLERMFVARKLLCGHYFHQFCIMQMIMNCGNGCPICRADIYTGKPERAQRQDNTQRIAGNENVLAGREYINGQLPNAEIDRVREAFPNLSVEEILAEIGRVGTVEQAMMSFAERI